MNHLGATRTRLTPHYAFVAPDGHVQTVLPGWWGAQGVILISPQMGARFMQYRALLGSGGSSGPPLPGVERFVFVEEGGLEFSAGDTRGNLNAGGYLYLPPDTPHTLGSSGKSVLTLFERRYVGLEGAQTPQVVWGSEADVQGEAFLGDEGVTVRKLLPDIPSFDMAVNTMTFAPGATLPFAETHVMEHGMLMLSGGGVYRLGADWHPIQQGDVLWMGPYCPQWFGALGKEPAKYLLYKETNRDPLAFERES